MPVQRVIRRIEIEHDRFGRRLVRLEEQVDEQFLDRRALVADLMVARRRRGRVLEPVERALARERRAILAPRGELAGKRRQHRVMPQVIGVDQVFVAERDAEHPLRDHGLDGVLDLRLRATVDKTRREPPHQTNRPIGRAEQQRAGVRRAVATVERGDHLAAFNYFIPEQIAVTLRWHRGAPPDRLKSLSQKNYRRFRAPMHLLPVRNPG